MASPAHPARTPSARWRGRPVRRVAIVASASGNGETTLGRELARTLEVPFVEPDALVHGPGRVETPDDGLRALPDPALASDGWVDDGRLRSPAEVARLLDEVGRR